MRTSLPRVLPLFRSEMQLRLLALLLLQPERDWTLSDLAATLNSPKSSVHRELERGEAAGIIVREAGFRPHQFRAADQDALYEPLAMLLQRTVGLEAELRCAVARPEVSAAVIYGSWANGTRRPNSDVDVLVVGDVDLAGLRRELRTIGARAGRSVDLIVMAPDEFRQMISDHASFAQSVLTKPVIKLVGDLDQVARGD